uniref:MerR family transcriptional regulator n=1 Tax=Pseudooctadecabacter sp. TaxID=1966338 RepID=UPI0035C7F13D
MSKSRDAFRTISEVSEALDVPAHVLRFWESKFAQVKPVKRAGGRRYYRPADVDLLAGIKKLLHEDGMTIKGAQKLLREQGVKSVSAVGAALLPGNTVDAAPEPTPPEATVPADPAPTEPEATVEI